MHKIISIIILGLLLSAKGINLPCLAQENETDAEQLWSNAIKAFEKKDTAGALDSYNKLVQICIETNDKQGIASVYGSIAVVYESMGNHNKAVEYYSKSLDTAKELGDQRLVVVNLNNIGDVYNRIGEYEKAKEYLNDSLRVAKNIRYEEGLLYAMTDMGKVVCNLGQYNKGLEYFNDSLKICRELDNKLGIADNLNHIGEAYRCLGDYNKALDYFNESAVINKETGNNLGIAVNLKNTGVTYGKLGQYNKGLEYFNDSLKICREIGYKEGVADNLCSIGSSYNYIGEYNKAIEYYNESLNIDGEIGNKLGVSVNLGNIGTIYLSLGNYNKALEYFIKALKICKEIGYKQGGASNLTNIGLSYQALGDYDKALDYVNEALSIDNQINSPEGIWRDKIILGSIYERKGNTNDALRYYKSCVNVIESIRSRLKYEEDKLSFVENKMSAYDKIILLLLKLNKKSEALDYVERAKSRALLDLLAERINPKDTKSRELTQEEIELNNEVGALMNRVEKESLKQDKQQEKTEETQRAQELDTLRGQYQAVINDISNKDPEFASFLTVEPLKSNEIEDLLGKDTTLLEYYVTKDKLIIWVLSNAKLNVAEVSVTQAQLKNYISELRENIENRSDNYKEISRKLYKLLIEPAKPYIKTTRLCIVPHNSLHYLSFPALLNNDKFLIEDYIIFYSSNASLLKFCFDKRKKTIDNLLAFGNPDNSLKNAEIEVNEIKKDFPKSSVFVGDAASESKVKELADSYNIVHFACHGELDPINPLYSSLKLAKDAQEDGRLEVWEIYEMNLKNAALVTLSACQTALGNITDGDEIIGLTRGFIYAGAPSIVASLWDIDDASTSILMQEFYSQLKQNHSKSESLRLAQLKLIRDKTKGQNTGHSHPFYWAAFELIGDWK